MTGPSGRWLAVLRELDRWRASGRTARLWMRDDDSVDDTPNLRSLIALSRRHHIPVLLACIPRGATRALAGAIADWKLAQPACHGFSHANHAPPGEKSAELGPHRDAATVLRELAEGRSLLEELFRGRVSGVAVPPWNRISDEVAQRLPEAGFDAVSTFGSAHEAAGAAGIRQVNTHLDIIDWKGTRGGRDPDWLTAELAKLLRARAASGFGPVGILSHHLVHDEAAWNFLEELANIVGQHSAACWAAVDDIDEC